MEHEHLKFYSNSVRFQSDPHAAALMMPGGLTGGIAPPPSAGSGSSAFYPTLTGGGADDEDDDGRSSKKRVRDTTKTAVEKQAEIVEYLKTVPRDQRVTYVDIKRGTVNS
jgi:hypothetical protein